MGITTSFVTSYTDSISKQFTDISTNFITNTSSAVASIISNVSGTGANNTYGRVLATGDSQTELNLLAVTNTAASNMSLNLNSQLSLNGYYVPWYPVFNALDLAVGGLNTYLTTNSIQVSGWFAAGYNTWCAVATQVTPGRSSSNPPTPISAGNYFPTADVDNVWVFTCGSGTTMTSSAAGANPNTNGAGGGYGQLVIYKPDAGAPVGGATFTITYQLPSGSNTTATYSTTSSVPAGSGSLSAAYNVTGATQVASIISVTGTGMTASERYILGIKRPRTPAY
jgi:hypothetical protein